MPINSCNVCSYCSSSPRGPSTSPSAHSISTPEKNRFPRGTTSRSTFHGAQLRDRRSATYNGPPASPTLSHDTGALAQQRRGTSTGIISKITSKFVRRSVKTHSCRFDMFSCIVPKTCLRVFGHNETMGIQKPYWVSFSRLVSMTSKALTLLIQLAPCVTFKLPHVLEAHSFFSFSPRLELCLSGRPGGRRT